MARQYVVKATQNVLRGGQYMLVPAASRGLVRPMTSLLLSPLRLIPRLLLLPLTFLFSFARPSPYGAYRTHGGMFSNAGNILILALVGFIFFDRAYLNHSLPGWERFIGIPAFMFAALALCGALYGSIRSITICCFWIFATFLIGRAVMYPSYATAHTTTAGGLQLIEGEGDLQYFVMNEKGTRGNRQHEVGYLTQVSQAVSGVGDSVSGAYNGAKKSVANLGSSMQREVADGISGLVKTLSLDSTPMGRGLMDSVSSGGSALPETAYFGRSLKGRKFYPMPTSRGKGFGGLTQGLESLLGR